MSAVEPEGAMISLEVTKKQARVIQTALSLYANKCPEALALRDMVEAGLVDCIVAEVRERQRREAP